MRLQRIQVLTVVLLMSSPMFVAAQTPTTFVPDSTTLVVAVFPSAPHIIKKGDGYTGSDIELWERVAEKLGLKFVYHASPFQNILTNVAEGRADVAISGITITKKREEVLDFSHAYYNSGLHIMVRNERDSGIRYYSLSGSSSCSRSHQVS
jgi:glutamine transport system substrate-binding protein